MGFFDGFWKAIQEGDKAIIESNERIQKAKYASQQEQKHIHLHKHEADSIYNELSINSSSTLDDVRKLPKEDKLKIIKVLMSEDGEE